MCERFAHFATSSVEQVEDADHEDEADHEEGEDEHPPEEHEEGGPEVPEDTAGVPNPISTSDESITIGEELYATNCALCHGETGEGDGPTASGLATAPADLHEDHVQGLTDGALFYIISYSEPGSLMPAWEDVLDFCGLSISEMIRKILQNLDVQLLSLHRERLLKNLGSVAIMDASEIGRGSP